MCGAHCSPSSTQHPNIIGIIFKADRVQYIGEDTQKCLKVFIHWCISSFKLEKLILIGKEPHVSPEPQVGHPWHLYRCKTLQSHNTTVLAIRLPAEDFGRLFLESFTTDRYRLHSLHLRKKKKERDHFCVTFQTDRLEDKADSELCYFKHCMWM